MDLVYVIKILVQAYHGLLDLSLLQSEADLRSLWLQLRFQFSLIWESLNPATMPAFAWLLVDSPNPYAKQQAYFAISFGIEDNCNTLKNPNIYCFTDFKLLVLIFDQERSK